MDDELKYWLALLRAPQVGAVKARALVEYFGGAAAVFSGNRQAWQALGCKGESIDWLRAPDWQAVQLDLDWLAQPGHQFIPYTSERWPSRLNEIASAPLGLFAMGDWELATLPQLAIVGSRNPTAAGRDAALEFGRHLSAQGVVVTSGMALGIDAAAHQGALAAGGLTVAVCGTGLDRVYPRANHALAKQIAQHGLLLSEFPIGTPVVGYNFPRRNRIIAGLALGTLVVEAAVRSGSLITARYASEQGREVFAMPGSIHNPLARGCHALIRDGAKLVENAEHILEELAPQLGHAGREIASSVPSRTEPEGGHTEAEPELLVHLGYDPISADALVERSGLTVAEVSAMLVMLELDGWVSKTPNGKYQRMKAP